jgi:hypothetical protein
MGDSRGDSQPELTARTERGLRQLMMVIRGHAPLAGRCAASAYGRSATMIIRWWSAVSGTM